MKFLGNIYTALSFVLCLHVQQLFSAILAEHGQDIKTTTTWYITSPAGVQVIDPKTDGTSFKFKSKKVTFTICNGQIACNGKEFFGDEITIEPLHGFLSFQNKNCPFGIKVIKKQKKVTLVSSEGSGDKKESTASIKDHPLHVRVLLDEITPENNHIWHITCPGGIMIINTVNKDRVCCPSLSTATITRKNGAVYLNGRRVKVDAWMILPLDGYLSFEQGYYQGAFLIYNDEKKSSLINRLDIEDYVFSVLKTESWPGWPLEVNKAFAIASRSYVMSMMLNAQKNKRLYHVKNTNFHQTYTGIHATSLLKTAVDQTKGIILTHNNKPIVAMFDCCCGGVIPALMHGVDFKKAPYLERTQPCDFCKQCKIYKWRVQYEMNELTQALRGYIPSGQRFQELAITKKDKAGIVQEVALKSSQKTTPIKGKTLYSLFKEIKSFSFDIHKKGKHIILTGRGYGHHLGICQWGARHMVKEGWDYKRILQFYYVGVDFMKVG